MEPQISEFSYGFALTHEIINATKSRTVAPIFPSLYRESLVGYDVQINLGAPFVPLFLQFKLSHCMIRNTAYEISRYNFPVTTPFYRFNLYSRVKSHQHDLLCQLDQFDELVFYAAPIFSTLEQFNSLYASRRILDRTRFVSPMSIGPFRDNDDHSIAFNDKSGLYFCSEEPRQIEGRKTIAELEELFQRKLTGEEGKRLVLEELEAIGKNMETVLRKKLKEVSATAPDTEKKDDDEGQVKQMLTYISDMALANYGCQFFVIQPAVASEG